jgi:hypothetical protein
MTTKGTILKAIRRNCLACCCQSVKEVSNCKITGCELHPFRMGVDPNPTRTWRNIKTPLTGDEFSQNEGEVIVKGGGV